MSLSNKYASLPNGVHLRLSFADDFVVAANVTLLATVLEIHPQRIAKVACRLATLIDDFQLLKKSPHAVVDAVAKLFPQANMVLEPGCEIAQHWVDLRGQRH